MANDGENQSPQQGDEGQLEAVTTLTMETGDTSPPPEYVSPEAPVGVAIQINAHDIVPESQMPGGDDFKEDASRTNYIIVQFIQLPTVEQERQLEDLQVLSCRKIPPSTWIAKYEPQDLSPIRALPFVVYANPFHQRLSLNSRLEAKLSERASPHGFAAAGTSSSKPDELINVFIMLHPMARDPDQMRDFLVSHHSIPRERITTEIHCLCASLTGDQIRRVAKIDDVSGIHEEPKKVAGSHLVSGVVRSLDATVVAQQYYTGLNLDGDGEIIVVADSGLDNGKKERGWTDIFDPVHPFFRTRILHLDPRSKAKGRDRDGNPVTRENKTDDLKAHGTHVAGIALGSYDGMVASPEIRLQGTNLNGVAPKASLVMQNIFGLPTYDAARNLTSSGIADFNYGDLPNTRLIADPYLGYPPGYNRRNGGLVPTGSGLLGWPKGARIHNNSWGAELNPATAGYDGSGELLDIIASQYPDMLIVFGAGNDGDFNTTPAAFRPNGQITGDASAKNVLTVGACFNENQFIRSAHPTGTSNSIRLYEKYLRQSDGGVPIASHHVSHASSRGPTAVTAAHADIIKPDVVAPGITIYSANSRSRVTAEGFGVAPNPNNLATFSSGTSMATPVVSGAAALLRQALRRRGFPDPTSALMKALIVNGATDLATKNGLLYHGNPTSAGGSNDTNSVALTAAPNDIQGWGRLNVVLSVENIVNTTLCNFQDIFLPDGVVAGSNADPRLRHTTPTGAPASHPWPVSIPPADASSTRQRANIRATLAWTDMTGAGLQNQLALAIEFLDPARTGRNITVDSAGTGPDPTLIRIAKNNVQRLEINNIDMTGVAAEETVDLVVKVSVVNLVVNRWVPPGTSKVNQEYGVCWRVWYS